MSVKVGLAGKAFVDLGIVGLVREGNDSDLFGVSYGIPPNFSIVIITKQTESKQVIEFDSKKERDEALDLLMAALKADGTEIPTTD